MVIVNIKNCGIVTVSLSQAATITRFLQSTGLTGTVKIMYKYGAAGGKESAENLAKALQDSGIDASAPGSQMVGGCDAAMQQEIPGLSLNCILDKDDPLTNAIASALVLSQVVPFPVHASPNIYPPNNNPKFLAITIRKP
jgi:hypothetical protein